MLSNIACMIIVDFIVLQKERDLMVDNITFTKSYKCDANVTHSFHSNEFNSTAVLRTTSLQLQAFRFNNENGDFGSGKFNKSYLLLPTIV